MCELLRIWIDNNLNNVDHVIAACKEGGQQLVKEYVTLWWLHDDEYDTPGHQLILSNWILKVEKYLNEPTQELNFAAQLDQWWRWCTYFKSNLSSFIWDYLSLVKMFNILITKISTLGSTMAMSKRYIDLLKTIKCYFPVVALSSEEMLSQTIRQLWWTNYRQEQLNRQ